MKQVTVSSEKLQHLSWLLEPQLIMADVKDAAERRREAEQERRR
jgi:hypothetical protein